MWKDLTNKPQFENIQTIRLHVNCDENGNIWQTMHNLKIHKWLGDKSIALIVERFHE